MSAPIRWDRGAAERRRRTGTTYLLRRESSDCRRGAYVCSTIGGMTRGLWCILLMAASCSGQGARILIVTDLEGAGGVTDADEQLLPGQRRYPESRRILTGEV